MSALETNQALTSQLPDTDGSAATSVNGSTATNETANTEASSTTPETPVVETPAAVSKPASVPPKVNPWKVRAEQSTASTQGGSQDGASKGVVEINATDSTKTVFPSQDAKPASADVGATTAAPRRTHKASRSNAPAIDDATLWPTLDKAVEERDTAAQRKQVNGDNGDNVAPSAPKVTGKEKWTKYTPTIMYTPIPSKSGRGGASGSKPAPRGGSAARTGGREKSHGDSGENGHEGTKSPGSSETSRARAPKARSLSASTSRTDRPARHESQQNRDGEGLPSATRSQSSKRSDRGSTSAPTGNTPVSDASKSPQMPHSNGVTADSTSHANGGEHRAHRSSYDPSLASRGRGGYRGSRGNYQGNFNQRYNNFVQPQLPGPRGYGQQGQMPYGYDQYQNFVNPSLGQVMIDPMVARQMVLNQCEYYFSIENLCKDMFLRKHMDEDGFVNLPILANFNRVRAITMDYALIRDVCIMSSTIEMRATPGAYDKIRRAEGWEQWVLPADQRDASTKAVPEAVPEIPVIKDAEDEGRQTGSNIAAPAFVPGQSSSSDAQPSNILNENFANLGMGRKLSPDVKEFKTNQVSADA